jgi:hypothetical protein
MLSVILILFVFRCFSRRTNALEIAPDTATPAAFRGHRSFRQISGMNVNAEQNQRGTWCVGFDHGT